MPITATFTSVSATTVALPGLAVEDRELAEVRARADPAQLDAVLLYDGLALDDHEERVARLAFADQVDPGRAARRSARAGRRSAAGGWCTSKTGATSANRSASSRFVPTCPPPLGVRPGHPASTIRSSVLSHLGDAGVD